MTNQNAGSFLHDVRTFHMVFFIYKTRLSYRPLADLQCFWDSSLKSTCCVLPWHRNALQKWNSFKYLERNESSYSFLHSLYKLSCFLSTYKTSQKHEMIQCVLCTDSLSWSVNFSSHVSIYERALYSSDRCCFPLLLFLQSHFKSYF